MPLEEFWHGDMRLLEAYQKAYERNVSYTAWQQGLHTFIALDTVYYNYWGKKQNDKNKNYPDWKDPIEQLYKPKITKENLEKEFRNQQIKQNAWLSSILNKK